MKENRERGRGKGTDHLGLSLGVVSSDFFTGKRRKTKAFWLLRCGSGFWLFFPGKGEERRLSDGCLFAAQSEVW
ncbi:hypothetical protein KY290_010960 [Solanum tuberosum]|uniref:Uncharacterized protein n=1 Tax=Solanum tuberosum TaxID=4113 RepID=A0ABQ7VZ94_SOLTU|nr:hypothetical protein KY290_010960 [Solanum tuberosum]